MSITNGYATLAQVKASIGMGTAADPSDSQLEMAVEAASRLIDADCDRVFYTSGTAVARVYTPTDYFTLAIDDNLAITQLATDDNLDNTYSTVWAASDYLTTPVNNLSGGAPWPTTGLRALTGGSAAARIFPMWAGHTTVKVTGTWGFGTAVPTMVTQAAILQAGRIYKRADSPLGVAGFGDMGAVRVSRTDPDVYALIRPFKKLSVA